MVVAKTPAPITSTTTFTGRRAAARVTRRRCAGERGPLSAWLPWRSGSIVRVPVRGGRDPDGGAVLEPERLGGVAFVYGEAEAPVRVRDQHQLARFGRPEGLHVADRHFAVAHVHPQGGAVLEPRLFLAHRQPGVAVAVYGDDPGAHSRAGYLLGPRQSETHEGSGVRRLSH